MDFFADIFLGTGALAAAFYCLILSRRLSRLTQLDQDLGSAIAVMSKQVDEMTKVLASARESATTSSQNLQEVTVRAEDVAERMQLMMAALHDLPETPEAASEPEAETADVSVFVRHNASTLEAAE